MRTPRTPRPSAVLSALVTLLLVAALAPGAANACSCVPPDMIIDSLGAPEDQSVVFSGTVGPAVGNTVPVQVIGWYGGPPPAAIVTLEVEPGDGANCGTTPPPAGRQFLFASYPTGTGAYGLNLCSLAADLATPEGQAILQDVTAKLGPPVQPAEDPPPEPAPEPAPAGLFGLAVEPAELAAIGGVLLLAMLVVGAVFVLAGRRRKA